MGRGWPSMDGDSGRDPRKPVAPHATHARSRRELLALAQSAPGRAGQEEDGERRRRLKAFADRHALSRRQFLQLAGAGGFLVVLESSWPPTQIARGAADLSPAGAFAGSATATPAGGQVQPGARSAGEIDVQQVAPSFVASALRREDMLALRFEFFNLQLQGANVVRQQANQPAYIVVQFVHGTDVAPQAIVEQAFLKADEFQSDSELDPNDEPAPSEALAPPGSVGATLAGASRLAFRVPDDIDTIPFTLNDLLAWVNYEQSVASHALPRPRIIVAPEIIGILSGEPTAGATFNQIIIDPGIIIDLLRLIREPSAVETAIEAPGELIVSPSRLAGWAHALQPVTHDSRTELWHTRLGVRGQIPGSPGMWQVNETASFFRTIRAVWTPGFQRDVAPNPDVPGAFRTSLTPNDRWQLVRLTSDSLIPGFTPAPIEVNRLMLTALGAWLDVSGAWSPPPIRQSSSTFRSGATSRRWGGTTTCAWCTKDSSTRWGTPPHW